MNKIIIKQFEPCYIGNGWGNYIDIEDYKYNVNTSHSLPLVKKVVYEYYHNFKNDIEDNNKDNIKNNIKNNIEDTKYKSYKNVTNLIFKVSSTTFVTIMLTYLVIRAI